jgi:2-polyprenyl-3-methyl-5-hydroxy-6-metoxy-1,4-benzoquinol methylase
MTTQRVLACVAHHGTKNRPYLDRMLESFRAMSYPVTVVILSDRERTDLPDDVVVRVGTPTSDPWSLPFAHRQVFIDHLDSHDLFVYAEDDTLIEQRHLDTFVDLQAKLPDDIITGFQRFELHGDGRRSFCSIHSHYHWDVSSVVTHGGLTFARLTNDHGAAYALTRDQLVRAIGSGGFDVEPHSGRYDMLVSAATDVYTQCGMRKMFCLERIEDQLVHHMPNVYLGRLGVDERSFRAQLDVLASVAGQRVQPDRLLVPEVALDTDRWDRHSFPRRNTNLRTLLPVGSHRVLAVGVTSGDIESVLIQDGLEVVGIAADVVLGAVAEQRGVHVAHARLPDQDEVAALGSFDTLLLLDVLGYVEDPDALLARLRPALLPGGEIIATVADTDRYRLKNLLRKPTGRTPIPTSWAVHGLRPTNGRWLRRCLERAGFDQPRIRHRWSSRNDPVGRGGVRARFLGNAVFGQARQPLA